MNIQNIIDPFLTLRSRGITDPFYCRLVAMGTKTVGWIWRDPSSKPSNLRTGETFTLSLKDSSDVQITWMPIFEAVVRGERHAIQYAYWFMDQKPRVAGGLYQSIDDFTGGSSPWNRIASDFIPVRCGSYRDFTGERLWRHPSDDVKDWVKDPQRFLTSPNIRDHVLQILSEPLPNGEWVTIRRMFDNELEDCPG